MSIADYSTSLAVALRRAGFEAVDFDAVFELALTLGGRLERDYAREDGASFNPRPARVAQILLEDCREVVTPVVLAAAMLCSVDERSASEVLAQGKALASPVKKLIKEAKTPLERLAGASISEEAVCVALAVALDRARHVHLIAADALAPEQQKHSIAPNFTAQERVRSELVRGFTSCEEISEQICPAIALRISVWLRRNTSRAQKT